MRNVSSLFNHYENHSSHSPVNLLLPIKISFFRCLKCGNKSKRLSRFYELDLNIQGHLSLNQCIKEFLKVAYKAFTFIIILFALLLLKVYNTHVKFIYINFVLVL